MLNVPLSLSGGIAFSIICGFDKNILTQICFVVLIGLAAKNTILIVEFAKQKQDEGLDCFQAAVVAAKLRLSPHFMTPVFYVLIQGFSERKDSQPENVDSKKMTKVKPDNPKKSGNWNREYTRVNMN